VTELLAELISKNKHLRTLNLQKLAMTDQTLMPLVEPLSHALNVENLQLDFNNLAHSFIQNLTEKFKANKRNDNIKSRINS
jgi:hypothetical protein